MTSGKWSVRDIPDQGGRTFIVTGANSGIGLAAANVLARRGARVILAVRDVPKGESAAETIRAGGPTGELDVRALDLADLESVRAFAEGIASDGVAVDVLLNNAGIMMPPRSLNAQGQESQFATNHLGHFALTGLLLGAMGGPDPRIVTMTSGLHRRGQIRFDDLAGDRSYDPSVFYAQSKLANVLFGLELDRRLRAAGSPIRSLIAHPGWVQTGLQRSLGGVATTLMNLASPVAAQSATRGALPMLCAAISPAARGGAFYGPSGFMEMKGHPKLTRPSPAGLDEQVAKRLWDLSEAITGVKFPLAAALATA